RNHSIVRLRDRRKSHLDTPQPGTQFAVQKRGSFSLQVGGQADPHDLYSSYFPAHRGATRNKAVAVKNLKKCSRIPTSQNNVLSRNGRP
ncbi:hypothetical protein Bhyg_14442, partial [Pseudolycoriella hygida]